LGKVRTELVKRIAQELVDKYPKSFGVSFEENKQFLKQVQLEVTKRLRNRIAGYVTRIIRVAQAPAPEEEVPIPEETA